MGLFLTLLLLLVGSLANAATVIFDVRQLTGSAIQRDITIAPTNSPAWRLPNDSALYLSAPITLRPVNGIAQTNLVQGVYRITFAGLPGHVIIGVPETNGPIYAAHCVLTNAPIFSWDGPMNALSAPPVKPLGIVNRSAWPVVTNESNESVFSFPSVVFNGRYWHMYVDRLQPTPYERTIYLLTSQDQGKTWQRHGHVLSAGGSGDFSTETRVAVPVAWRDNDAFYMAYFSWFGSQAFIAFATSSDGTNWTKLYRYIEPAHWAHRFMEPAAILKYNNTNFLYHTTDYGDPNGRRIGVLWSQSISNWQYLPYPVITNTRPFSKGVFNGAVIPRGGRFYAIFPQYDVHFHSSTFDLWVADNPWLTNAAYYGPIMQPRALSGWEGRALDVIGLMSDDATRETWTAAGGRMKFFYGAMSRGRSWNGVFEPWLIGSAEFTFDQGVVQADSPGFAWHDFLAVNTTNIHLANRLTVEGRAWIMSNLFAQTVTSTNNIASLDGSFVGNASGLTNLPVSGIAATGTRDSTTFLRGDGTWAAPPGGGGGGTTEYVASANTNHITVSTNLPVYTLDVGNAVARTNLAQTFYGDTVIRTNLTAIGTIGAATAVFTNNIIGNGAGLTNLDASTLASGIVPVGRLPAELAWTNRAQTFFGDLEVRTNITTTNLIVRSTATVDALRFTTNTVRIGSDVLPATGTANYFSGVFIGGHAGPLAGNAEQAVAIGWRAAQNATNSIYRSVIIGPNAGEFATNAPYALIAGHTAGRSAGNLQESVAWGREAASDTLYSPYSVFVGGLAGRYTGNSPWATMLGYAAGEYAGSVTNMVAVGVESGRYATNSGWSVFIGGGAGRDFENSPYNIVIGGIRSDATSRVDRLMIHSRNTTIPLLYGEFDNRLLRVHGWLDVTNKVAASLFEGNAAGLTNLPVSGIAATGTRDSTTFLRGDGTWAAPPGGAGGGTTEYIAAGNGIAIETNGTLYTVSLQDELSVSSLTADDFIQSAGPVISGTELRVGDGMRFSDYLRLIDFGNSDNDSFINVGTERLYITNTLGVRIDSALEVQSAVVTNSLEVKGVIHGNGIGVTNIPLAGLAQSGAQAGQIPQWNGSQWTPASIPPGNLIDVQTYGAVPDDVADDWSAIQSALDALTNDTIYVGIYLPPGEYRLSQPLRVRRDGTRIVGGGWLEQTVLKVTTDASAIILDPQNNITPNALNGPELAYLAIQGPGYAVSTKPGVYFGRVDNPFGSDHYGNMGRMFYVDVRGFNIGVAVTNAYGVRIEQCEVQDNRIGLALHSAKFANVRGLKSGMVSFQNSVISNIVDNIAVLVSGYSSSVEISSWEAIKVRWALRVTGTTGDDFAYAAIINGAKINDIHSGDAAIVLSNTPILMLNSTVFAGNRPAVFCARATTGTAAQQAWRSAFLGCYFESTGFRPAIEVMNDMRPPLVWGANIGVTNTGTGITYLANGITSLWQLSTPSSLGIGDVSLRWVDRDWGNVYWGAGMEGSSDWALYRGYGSTWERVMRINRADGNVSIGAVVPSSTSKLLVGGNVAVSGSFYGNGSGLTNVPLSAIAQSGASVGQVPQWNGSSWVPATVSGGGLNTTNAMPDYPFSLPITVDPAAGNPRAGWTPAPAAMLDYWAPSMWFHVPNSGTTPAASPGGTFTIDGIAAAVRTNTIGDISAYSINISTNGSDASARLRYGGNLAPRAGAWGGFRAIIGINHTNNCRIYIGPGTATLNVPDDGGSTSVKLIGLAVIGGEWKYVFHPGSGAVSYQSFSPRIFASTNNGGNYAIAGLVLPDGRMQFVINGHVFIPGNTVSSLLSDSDAVPTHVFYTATAPNVTAGMRVYRLEIIERERRWEPLW